MAQGAQHLGGGLRTDIVQVEGGFQKVLVELGWVGALAALSVAYQAVSALAKVRAASIRAGTAIRSAGLFAFLAAQVSVFFVAFQVFGDPLIVFLIGVVLGWALAWPEDADGGPTVDQAAPNAAQ